MGSYSRQMNENGEENWALCNGKPFFSIIISKYHLKPAFQMVFPAKMSSILPLTSMVPMIMSNRSRNWTATYEVEHMASKVIRRSCKNGWKDFAIDMNLKAGDACVFELMENTTQLIKLRVQILRGDLPAKFQTDEGDTSDTPIIIE